MIVMCALVTGTPPTSRQKHAAVKVKHCPSAFTLRHLARIVVRIKWCKVGDNNYFLNAYVNPQMVPFDTQYKVPLTNTEIL